jgi:hypothetical protein
MHSTIQGKWLLGREARSPLKLLCRFAADTNAACFVMQFESSVLLVCTKMTAAPNASVSAWTKVQSHSF